MSRRRSEFSPSSVLDASRETVSDAELTHGLVSGATWANTVTWNRFAPMVLKMCERALGSRTDAEDVAQDVFHAVYRKVSGLRDPSKLRSFVYSFAIRSLRAELRRRRLFARIFHSTDGLVEVSSHNQPVESRDLLRRFYALLQRLSSRDRAVFILRHLEAMTTEEVASVTKLSVSTVKRSVKYATSRLHYWSETDAELARLIAERRWDA